MLNGKKIGVIVPAAGRGTRLVSKESKQFLDINGKPVVLHVLERFERCNEVDIITIAINELYRGKLLQLVHEYCLTKVVKIVIGGVERKDSVRNCRTAF